MARRGTILELPRRLLAAAGIVALLVSQFSLAPAAADAGAGAHCAIAEPAPCCRSHAEAAESSRACHPRAAACGHAHPGAAANRAARAIAAPNSIKLCACAPLPGAPSAPFDPDRAPARSGRSAESSPAPFGSDCAAMPSARALPRARSGPGVPRPCSNLPAYLELRRVLI